MFIIHTFICVFCDHYLFLLQNKYEHLWHQLRDTKRDPWVILYTSIAQLMIHTTVVYVAAYLAIMLPSFLVYCRG